MILSRREKSRFDFWSLNFRKTVFQQNFDVDWNLQHLLKRTIEEKFQQKIKARNETIVENFTSPDKLKKEKKILSTYEFVTLISAIHMTIMDYSF